MQSRRTQASKRLRFGRVGLYLAGHSSLPIGASGVHNIGHRSGAKVDRREGTNEMKAKVGRAGYENVKDRYVNMLRLAIQTGSLPDLHRECILKLNDLHNPEEVPYAFAYAARAILHDRDNWCVAADRIKPKEDAIYRINELLQNSNAINSRENYYYSVVEGVRDFVINNIPESYVHFSKVSRFGDYYRVVKDDFGGGASFCKSFPTIGDLEADSIELPAPQFWKISGESLGSCFSVSFDVLYANAFFRSWIRRVEEIGARHDGLHFHVIFRHKVDEALLDSMAKAGKNLGGRLIISFEITSGEFDRAYFASARFLHGRTFLDKFGCPIWFVDADAELVESQTPLNPRAHASDRVHGLLSFGPNYGYVPWRAFGATWLYAPASGAAAGFLDLVSQCIKYLWDERAGRNWWIDQFGLKTAELFSRQHQPMLTPQSLGGQLRAPFKTSEAYKIASISKIPEIAERISQGIPYARAVREVASAL